MYQNTVIYSFSDKPEVESIDTMAVLDDLVSRVASLHDDTNSQLTGMDTMLNERIPMETDDVTVERRASSKDRDEVLSLESLESDDGNKSVKADRLEDGILFC